MVTDNKFGSVWVIGSARFLRRMRLLSLLKMSSLLKSMSKPISKLNWQKQAGKGRLLTLLTLLIQITQSGHSIKNRTLFTTAPKRRVSGEQKVDRTRAVNANSALTELPLTYLEELF